MEKAKFTGLSHFRQMCRFFGLNRKQLLYFSLLAVAVIYLRADQTPGKQLERICPLPGELTESSGLVVQDNNTFWSINDSGGEAVLYQFDSTGRLTTKRLVIGASNTDWESLTNQGDTLYIGDIGNNLNSRTNLCFWALDLNDRGADQLPFAYPDQQHLPPPRNNWNFDAEGSFYHDSALYWFSKTRVKARPRTKLYRMRTQPKAKAELIDSFRIDHMITGADISPDGKTVVLMGYGKVFRLHPFDPDHLSKLEIESISIPKSQTESVAFLGSDQCYFTDEQGSLYRMSMKRFE